jgi:hypothetical protein
LPAVVASISASIIDIALLIVPRYRKQLQRQPSDTEAASTVQQGAA